MKNLKRYVLGVLVAATTLIAAFSTDAFSGFLGGLAVTDVVMVLVLFGIFVVSQVGGNPLMDKLMMSRMRSDRRFTQLTQTFFAAAASYAVLVYLIEGTMDLFLVAIALAVVLGMFTNVLSALMSSTSPSKHSKPSSEMGDMDGMSRSSDKETASEIIRMPAVVSKAKKKRRKKKKKKGRRKKKSR